MFTLDYRSRKPLYDQLCQSIERMAACGVLEPGSRLPSVRMLAEELAINPNTVQKAYRLLEEEGLILSHTGAKSTVVADEAAQSRVRGELLQAEVRDTIAAMKHMGLSRQEALALVDQLWKEGETP